jgi:hypothetical protein
LKHSGVPRLARLLGIPRDANMQVRYSYYAPAHTVGGTAFLPEGTVVIAFDQAPLLLIVQSGSACVTMPSR